jgi:hypothetical protein
MFTEMKEILDTWNYEKRSWYVSFSVISMNCV